MYLTTIDWIIVAVFICALTGVATYTRRYSRSVADFLSANRCAGRYLLCIAGGMAAMGAVSIITQFQASYVNGFAGGWWYVIFISPLVLLMILSGWIVYRFRETRALTTAQFFEIRYSRKFRIFSGLTAFIAGMINYGVFPAIGASFFIHFCGLPEHIGFISTFHLMMFSLMVISVYFTLCGGQVTVLATDFIQGMFMNFVFLAIFVLILWKIGISTIFEGLTYAPAGKSMLNPIDIQGNEGFNMSYYIIHAFIVFYGFKVWQGQQGYNSSARTPHEAKMAGIIGGFRWGAFLPAMTFVPLCAYAIMHHPDYADIAAKLQIIIDSIKNPEVRLQMTTPIVMTEFLPPGLMGCFTAAVLAAFITTHNTQLQSWASIFVQDVVLPFRKTPLSTKAHMWLLKLTVVMVAVFVFIFSCIFRQSQHFQIYAMVSGAVFVAGAGICVIGGLYWKKGTASGAWAAMITGGTISCVAILLEQYWLYAYDKSFPVNFKLWTVIAMASSFTIYIIFALVSGETFNMDRMLHRGKYGVKGEHNVKEPRRHMRWLKLLGMSNEFSRFDKVIWWYVLINSCITMLIFMVITIIYLTAGFSDKVWAKIHLFIKFYWLVPLIIPLVLWLTIGGFRDLYRFFKDLETAKRNDLDDGTVVNHHNLADEAEVFETNDSGE